MSVLLLIVKTTVLHVKIACHHIPVETVKPYTRYQKAGRQDSTANFNKHLPKLFWCHKLCISLSTSPPSNASQHQRAQRYEGCGNQDLVTPARAENGNEAIMESVVGSKPHEGMSTKYKLAWQPVSACESVHS